MTRAQLLNLSARTVKPGIPCKADELWLVPIEKDTVIIAVNRAETPTHTIAAFTPSVDMPMHGTLRFSSEQINRTTSVTRIRPTVSGSQVVLCFIAEVLTIGVGWPITNFHFR
jgi:hypothetical protein